ncbi:hypothetical protein BSK63_17755 [Paenibacillus odorifer]|nr:hypothetical protein PODO_05200 [Paenibacillus odorifer]OME22892.1 hypothetical protein BSK57_16845 [Paenibacillus odorifer]OME30375.1 hypothetical protein BSK63_17755 [Paenibacillus odorifer]
MYKVQLEKVLAFAIFFRRKKSLIKLFQAIIMSSTHPLTAFSATIPQNAHSKVSLVVFRAVKFPVFL